MLRSMYSGISGLKNFQTKLDVIGNNIANVNTYGFKKGRVIFKDLMSQTVAGASAPGDNLGGTNAKQIGLGASLAAIDTNHEKGSFQTTNRTLDIVINGDGYLSFTDGTNTSYTRAGNLYLDSAGTLVSPDGKKLLTEGGNTFPPIPSTATNLTIGQDGTVSYVENGTLVALDKIAVTRFSNPEGLTKTGGNYFAVSNNSGEPSASKTAGSDGNGTIESGFIEMSNVDLSEEFTEMIVAQRGFQANSRIITTSDEILQELVNLKR
ncbi:flagellar basal body rod protein FlgG [Kurthia sibirica]|uniref:Flagellar hook protein FlgE n=1 Tax=Kurthia sibirica TaxID=202750 RepID=A0A2U3AQS9_9BACL|nr:flagellar basal body rod protein FlgG [Kurthia sibirica]PWI26902.1 flagellar basal body rod protein FlgG [Kurthia sibirica]GEK32557.1 flagellar basal-body rod protein FlgG [Kurthia sibirica]